MTNEVIELPQGISDDWCERTYFYDVPVAAKNYRIVTLQQQRMSEAFAASCEKRDKHYRMTLPAYLIGALLGFAASIACGVLWVVGEYPRLVTGFLFVVSWVVIYYCLRRVWRV